MLALSLTAFFAVFLLAAAAPTSYKQDVLDEPPIAELPENWDQTKDDTKSLFLNKSDKNDLEPYPLALSEEGNSDAEEPALEQTIGGVPAHGRGEIDNLILRPELYEGPSAPDGLTPGYDARRRKRGSGKVGAGAATKVATKSGSGKKNLKSEEHQAPHPIDVLSHEMDALRRKRGSGSKVSGAAASAKATTKNTGNKKNLRPQIERRKRDSGLSATELRALLNLWEAQERRKQEYASQWADRYYGQNAMNSEEQPELDENGDVWYNEPAAAAPRERDFPRRSYFSEQNRMAVARGYPDMYQVDPDEVAQRFEAARRKRQYANKVKRFMVARKRSEPQGYRRDDLYTLAELLRSAPRQEPEPPVYRRLVV